jgi:hypothetical protein
VALTLLGCAPAAHRQAARLEGRYDLGDPGAGWKRASAGGADRAWLDKDSGAALYADSNCTPRFDELHSGALASELLAGLQDVKTLSEGELRLAGRVGVRRTHAASLDGVPVKLGVAVLNRDACTYDVVLVAPPSAFESALPAWERVLEGFAPRGER